MIKLKHNKELYIHNKNRNAIKRWLLNPPPNNYELLLKMMGFVSKDGVQFFVGFTNTFCDICYPLCSSCLKDLHLKEDWCNMYTFYCSLEALSRLLVHSDKLKRYKVHLKKNEIEKDF